MSTDVNTSVSVPSHYVSRIDLQYFPYGKLHERPLINVSSTENLQFLIFPDDFTSIRGVEIKSVNHKIFPHCNYIEEIPKNLRTLTSDRVFFFIEMKEKKYLCLDPRFIFVVHQNNFETSSYSISQISSLIFAENEIKLVIGENPVNLHFKTKEDSQQTFLFLYSLSKQINK